MALDASTLLSRTAAGDAELSTPTNGLSLGQRKVLTYLDAPQALEELIAQRALDAAKLERDLAKLAAVGLVAINGQHAPPASSSESVVIGPARSTSMLRWLVPLLLLVGGAIGWLAFSGTAPRKPATTSIGTAATNPPAAEAPVNGAAAVAASAPSGIVDPRSVDPRTVAGAPVTDRGPSTALDARRAADARAAAVAPGVSARSPATSTAADSPQSNATMRAAAAASPTSGTAAEGSAAGSRTPLASAAPVAAATPATQVAGAASARNAGAGGAEGRAAQPADARNESRTTADPGRAAGPSPVNAATAKAVAPSVASAPSNAAAAGSAATAVQEPAGAVASVPPVTLAMAAPSSADAHPQPAQKLVPLTRENPEFPREALVRGVESGTVKARLTIDALGKVTAVSIVDARPARVFDRVVTQALSRWTFTPGDASRSTEVEIAFKRD